MIIYGVALLAFCFLTGNYIGDILGALLGVKANVGGVGFAMLLLIILTNKGIDAGWLDKKGQEGIAFWSAMYIPIVVAMSFPFRTLSPLYPAERSLYWAEYWA